MTGLEGFSPLQVRNDGHTITYYKAITPKNKPQGIQIIVCVICGSFYVNGLSSVATGATKRCSVKPLVNCSVLSVWLNIPHNNLNYQC